MAINTTSDLNLVNTTQIVDEAVTTDKLAGQAVTAAKIHPDAVTESKIANDAVTAAKIAAGAVGASELASASVGTAKIDSGAATSGQFLGANGSGGASFINVEGTVIKSTGATSGYVLTAGVGGTATTWSALPAGGGQVTFSSLVGAAYGTSSTADGTIYAYTSFSSASYGFHAAVSHGGTLITFLSRGTASTTTFNSRFTTIELTNTTSVANTTVNLGVGGTVQSSVAGDQFKGGTAVVAVSSGALSSTWTGKVSKWNKNGTQMWITTFNTFTSDGGAMDSYAGYNYAMVRYASAPDVYYWGEQVYPYSTVTNIAAGTGRHSKVYIVNNTSGSVYSAAFSSAATTTSYNGVRTLWFVPDNVGTPTAGTIHAVGYQDGTPQYVKYTVGSASITAVSTATGTFANSGQGEIAPFGPIGQINSAPFYHTDGSVYMYTGYGAKILERTCGTVLFNGPQGYSSFYHPGYAAPELQQDFDNGFTFGPARYDISQGNQSTLWKMGSKDESLVGARPYARWASKDYPNPTAESYAGIFAGAGSVTTAVWWMYYGERAVSFKHTNNVGLAKITLPGTGKRLIMESARAGGVDVALEANGTSYPNFNIHNSYYFTRDMDSNFVVTSGTAYLWVSRDDQTTFGTAGFLSSTWNQGGSAQRSFVQITLS